MVTLQSFRVPASPRQGPGLVRPLPSPQALRELCCSLLADVPASDRKAMLLGLDRMRRADDLGQLRGALFETIARCHGTALARERVAELDARLR